MNYPGVSQPGWWYSNATIMTTATANTAWAQPQLQVLPQAQAAPQPPKSHVDWLRERVGEVCDLAFEVAA